MIIQEMEKCLITNRLFSCVSLPHYINVENIGWILGRNIMWSTSYRYEISHLTKTLRGRFFGLKKRGIFYLAHLRTFIFGKICCFFFFRSFLISVCHKVLLNSYIPKENEIWRYSFIPKLRTISNKWSNNVQIYNE